MLKKGFLLGFSNTFLAVISLIRNIMIARLISVENFGVSSTFAIVISLIEMASYTGIDRLIIQANDVDERELQKTLQAIQMTRGILGATAMFMLADFIALVFNLQELVWSYRLLALVPLTRGFMHLDVFRAQREMRYVPQISVDLSSIIISTAMVYPLVLWFGDYRVMLFAILIQQGIYVVGTHVMSSSRYRIGWDLAFAKKTLVFGWPLLLNGMLLFVTFNGDRLLVASFIGMTELGWFSAAFALAMAPTLVIAKTLDGFFLPQLSKVQGDREAYAGLHLATLEAAVLAGALVALGFAMLGPWFVLQLYGDKYQPASMLVVLIAVMQAIRIAKAGPAIAAMAKAETDIPMISNAIRLIAFPTAWLAIEAGGGIVEVIVIAIGAELLGFLVSLSLLRKRLKLPLRPALVPVLGVLIALGWIGIDHSLFPRLSLVEQIGHVVPIVLFVGLVAWFMRDLRKWIKDLRIG